MTTVALFFVASPLQYLAAQQIAQAHEQASRKVLVWYQPGIKKIIHADEWDASTFMPAPRRAPMSGYLGRHRRIENNLDLISNMVGPCDKLHIHSAVFDSETINYFLHALPSLVNAKEMHARILPDGLISIRRYPLTPFKYALQHLRCVRRIISPRLKYTTFKGDRIGSDASFCDRIYVLSGLPHEYPPEKVVQLQPLVSHSQIKQETGLQRCALVIGQPMVGSGLMKAIDRDQTTQSIHAWIQQNDIQKVHYKAHPKDPAKELCHQDYEILNIQEPLETWLTRHRYDAVLGTRSSALMFAAQLYGPNTRVMAFGWQHIQFKSAAEQKAMTNAFMQSGVQLMA